MREMLSAAKRPKKMHFLSSVLKKKQVFWGRNKSGIRVFIEAWYLSTRLPGGWFEKIRTLNTNKGSSPLSQKHRKKQKIQNLRIFDNVEFSQLIVYQKLFSKHENFQEVN